MWKADKTSTELSRHLAKSILLEETGSPMMIRLVILFSCGVVATFMIWAMTTNVDEVAVATGEVVPTGQVQKVQHLEGGIIADIFVMDGSFVEKDQTLIRINTDVIMSQLKQAQAQQQALLVQKERLVALIQGVKPDFSKAGKAISEFTEDQKRIFEHIQGLRRARRAALQSQIDQLRLEELAERSTLLTELSQVDEELTQVREVISRYQRKISHSNIRAPISGIVHGFTGYTIGGVVPPGATIMEIVPKDRKMIAEIQISSRDIGHIKIGQSVILKFTTYDFSRYGGLDGRIREISAMTFLDRQGNPYYKGIVLVDKSYIGTNPRTNPILPGMIVQADIKTGSKTVMEYLLKPIFVSAKQALRER